MKQPIPSDKTLIALLFWSGDKNQAMHLARLLADLEPTHSEKADFLFVSRFDCTHDEKTISYVSRKFNVHAYTSKRRGTGWPNGCNAVFFGMLEWAYHKMRAGLVPNYKNILVVASDGAPLKKDWLSDFRKAWDAARSKVAGALLTDKQYLHDHINGDCMMMSGDLDFLKWLAIDVGDVNASAGWDWVLANEFKQRGWTNFPFVKSVWKRPELFTQKDWDDEVAAGTIWFHGQKGDSLLKLSRLNLCK